MGDFINNFFKELYNKFDMAKKNLKQVWQSITSQLTNKKSRARAFVFLTSFIFTYITLGGTIANFVTNIAPLCYYTLGFFAVFLILTIAEVIYFTKSKKGSDAFVTIPMLVLIALLVMTYLFLAPARSFYIYWICVIPICLFLSIGMFKGIIGSTILFISILLVFYVPGLYQYTSFTNTVDH